MKIDSREKDYVERAWIILDGDTSESVKQVCAIDDQTLEYVQADDPPQMAADGESVATYTKKARRIDIHMDTLVIRIWR